jgi:hypothetical protein
MTAPVDPDLITAIQEGVARGMRDGAPSEIAAAAAEALARQKAEDDIVARQKTKESIQRGKDRWHAKHSKKGKA